MKNSKVIKTKHLWHCGIAIFLLGFILGAVLILANFRTAMHILRPKPENMAIKLANHINSRLSKDFDIPETSQDNIRKIIISSQPKFKEVFESTRSKLDEVRENIIVEISKQIPDSKNRKMFLENIDKYFPPAPPGPFSDKRPPPPPPPIFK